ncbi:MAG: SRPBCC domain-containing protein, partial [Gammaproteobacteria bacterium]|nr:SRPBCC domain-containing protein [Gammaproteobacteria bacterium]
MARASELGGGAIRFERIYDASIEDVWALWTTKEGLEEWFAPEGMHVEVSVLELR